MDNAGDSCSEWWLWAIAAAVVGDRDFDGILDTVAPVVSSSMSIHLESHVSQVDFERAVKNLGGLGDDESIWYRYTRHVKWTSRGDLVIQDMLSGRVEVTSIYMRCSMDEPRWYRYKTHVKGIRRYGIVIKDMLSGRVEVISLYKTC
ncbi:hypothetical protein Tco_0488548 [Tanacetum coccineum]